MDEDYVELGGLLDSPKKVLDSILASSSIHLARNITLREVPRDMVEKHKMAMLDECMVMAHQFAPIVSTTIGHASMSTIMVTSAVIATLIAEFVADTHFGETHPLTEEEGGVIFEGDIDPEEFN